MGGNRKLFSVVRTETTVGIKGITENQGGIIKDISSSVEMIL
jgi:hypothetical protein